MSVIEPARDVGDAGVLPVDHRVGEVHVGRRLVDEPLPLAVDDELRRHHALVEHELQPAVGPAHGREPPCLVEQFGGAADLLARADAVTHGGGIAEAPVLFERREDAPCATAMSWSKPPAARTTPRRAPMRCCWPSRSMTAPITVPSTSVISSVIGRSATAGCSAASSPAASGPPATGRSRPSGHRTPAPGTSARSVSPARPCPATYCRTW